MPDKSKCDRVFRSKTSMSNASFHNFHSRSNGLRCYFSANKLKFIYKAIRTFRISWQKTPRILGVFIRPSANFRESFASRSPKSRFFLLRRNFCLITVHFYFEVAERFTILCVFCFINPRYCNAFPSAPFKSVRLCSWSVIFKQ